MAMKEKDFNDVVTSVKQAGSIMRAEAAPSRRYVITDIDVKAIRDKVHATQAEFASMLGISQDTLQNWEQGRRHPAGPAQALLKIVAANPEYAASILTAS